MTLAMQPLTTCVGFLMLSLGPVSALQPGAAALRLRAAPSGLRTRVTTMEAAPTQCALISLSAEDPLRLAQVLKKAWMEGGVKRGLVGSVLVGAPARCRVTAASRHDPWLPWWRLAAPRVVRLLRLLGRAWAALGSPTHSEAWPRGHHPPPLPIPEPATAAAAAAAASHPPPLTQPPLTLPSGEDFVQIAAQGKTSSLQSFADWIESSSMLVTGVELMGLDSCPAENLTTKFPLADVESWSGAAPGSFTGALPDTT